MTRSRILFFAALGLASLLLPACRGMTQIAQPEVTPELVQQTREYLYGDEDTAGRLLPILSDHSVPELKEALKRALAASFDRSVPTGVLSGLPIQVNGLEMDYGLYVPPTYDPGRAYPLIICLHGAGFDGDTYLDRWKPRLGDEYLLACPTMEGGFWWTPEAEMLVLAVLSELLQKYHIDTDKVFLSGMSNGGIGAFLIGLNHVDRFAALVPMAAVLPRALFPLLENASNTPLYLIHGAQDQVMPVEYSRQVTEYLKRLGYPVVYREHDQVHPMAGGHFFPREELPGLLAWLKTQKRPGSPAELIAVRDRDHPGRANWIRFDEIAEDTASFWASEHDREEGQGLEEGSYARLIARIQDNTVTVTAERVLQYSLLLNQDLVDLSRPIRIVTNGQTSFEGRVEPDSRVLLREARRRPDLSQVVLTELKILVSP